MSSSSKGVVKVDKHSILVLDLSGEIVDRPLPPDPFGELMGNSVTPLAVTDIERALEAAADDKRIDGLYISCEGCSVGLANAQAVINAINKFKESGKWVVAYGDTYTQTDYFIACGADSVLLNPIGSVDIHGLAATTPYFKGLLDKLGVEMQVVKVGTYKSAVEPYLLTGPSEASIEQQRLYLDMIWNRVKGSIAEARTLPIELIDTYADSCMVALEAADYMRMKLIDGVKYWHEVEDMLMRYTDTDDRDDLNMLSVTDYITSTDMPSIKTKGTKNIAVLYAVGEISDAGSEGIIGPDMCAQIYDLIDDDDIDGLILRVNSPGGSAFASEQIWEALEQWKAVTGKPYYVSMCDYAASGGYYISCGADKIYAEPLTLTGSIGIFGMIPCIKGTLNDHLGINTSTVTTNTNGNFPSIVEPMTPQQRASMQQSVNRGYETFVSRVAAGRNMSADSVKMIAEGRVWDGATAQKIGLVDELGGLSMAINDMARELGVEASECRIEQYPDLEMKWWEQMLSITQAKATAHALNAELTPQTVELYRTIDRLLRMNPLQCRMETVELR